MKAQPYHYSKTHFPDLPHTVFGVEYRAGDTLSSMPMGGLGTGAIGLNSQGIFINQSISNSYRPVPLDSNSCGFDLQTVAQGKWLPFSNFVISYLAHFPIADYKCQIPNSAVKIELRALTPFIPGDAQASATPAALFRFRVHNGGKRTERIAIRFRWRPPIPVENNGISSAGNVDGFLRWNLGTLDPGQQAVTPVKFVATDSMQNLDALITHPHGDITLDENGAFNWEDTREQCLRTSAGDCLSQHGYYLHYQIAGANAPSRAGTPIIDHKPLENLTRVAYTPNSVELRTKDNALTMEVDRGDGVLTYHIRNTGKQPVHDLQLTVYANLEAGHTESDDNGWLDTKRNALVVTDSSGASCALSSDVPVSAGWCGLWGDTIKRMQKNQAIDTNQWTQSGNPLTTTISNDPTGHVITQETDHHAGCTIIALHDADVTETDTPTKRLEDQALVQSIHLKPGETHDMRFVLAWYYPDARDSDGKFTGHQYAHWFKDSKAAADYAADRWNELTARTGEWQERIYDNPHAPDALKDQLVNSLYSLARNTCWLYDGRFTHSESFIGCPITETIVCRFYGSLPLALFFPDLEKNTMKQFIRWQRTDGAIPFAFGQGERWNSPYYDTQKVLDSAEFVLMAWRDYTLWKDRDWAQAVYPAVKKALEYASTLNKSGENLPDNDLSGQYYDCWTFHGVSSYTGGIYLAALKAGEAFGALLNDTPFESACQMQFAKSQASYESNLWSGAYYRLWENRSTDQRSDTSLAAQLTGQWAASLCNLGDILPRKQMIKALEHIAHVNGGKSVRALVNGITPDGTRDQTGTNGHSDTATLGETWCYAATCIWLNKANLGLPFAKRLAEDIALNQRDSWATSWNMNPDTGAMLWGGEYYSNMCIWSLWLALNHQH